MTVVNTAQSEAWNGYEGRHWASHDARYDAMNGGFNPFVLGVIEPADRVLDIGCGNGQLTRLAARAGRSATGVDLSGPMLATARARAADVPNVGFVQGDAQVHPFETAAYDIAISRFGITFFADPIAAFSNIRRALAPGGRLAFLCMTALRGTDLGAVFDTMVDYLPWPTGDDGTGPTAFADPERTESVLTAAGYTDFACTKVEADQVWGSDVADAAEFISDWGPVRYHMGLAGPDNAAQARQALTEVLQRFVTPSAVALRGQAWLVQANA
ncbi:class I SAM-dependent methyltransferase [Kibdelosporangium phytohabitans]|uniref:Methyltransferase n=1 Tax=Kibdelosporangium phytohabitans TaxID=860235 RepID=A0A0N9IJE6_9PSEU|nr:class I SAM-dependent methyltransferase [Kibdelosporangium phytohabitans]ALG15225.1 methyltransferase [Kibdelosporangium phytohabitans]MBE1462226.1 SAM-dependent methyltransferase [Kibdelosporangium phytohabitans]